MASPSGSILAREVRAAGAVVLGPHRRVLVVHRPKYDDWSFPKGKVDPGEHDVSAAVREVREETGLRIRLGVPLGGQRYPVLAGTKAVRYWLARPVGNRDVRGFQAKEEIDEVRWVEAAHAASLLTHERDGQTLDEVRALPRKTRTLVVLRHGISQSRRTFRGRDDRRRPLLAAGRRQSEALVPLLGAYGVRRVLTSSSARCVQTVTPYARVTGRKVESIEDLSEEVADQGRVERVVSDVVVDLLATPPLHAASLICSHGPVLPWVWAALGLADPELAKGEMMVVHLAPDSPAVCERHVVG